MKYSDKTAQLEDLYVYKFYILRTPVVNMRAIIENKNILNINLKEYLNFILVFLPWGEGYQFSYDRIDY